MAYRVAGGGGSVEQLEKPSILTEMWAPGRERRRAHSAPQGRTGGGALLPHNTQNGLL